VGDYIAGAGAIAVISTLGGCRARSGRDPGNPSRSWRDGGTARLVCMSFIGVREIARLPPIDPLPRGSRCVTGR
jgi:hypothetical protein